MTFSNKNQELDLPRKHIDLFWGRSLGKELLPMDAFLAGDSRKGPTFYSVDIPAPT